MAADVMNYKLRELEKEGGKQALMLIQNEGPEFDSGRGDRRVLRATTSKIYDRVWNSQVTDFLLKLNRHLNGRFQPP